MADAFRAWAGSWVRRALNTPAQTSGRAAELGSPTVGALVTHRTERPADGQATVIPNEWSAANRLDHRHEWFAAAAAAGHADAAAEGVTGWLRFDRPGAGTGWTHGTDVAARLAHWHLGLGWIGGGSSELRSTMAGSARWHLEHLSRRMPPDGHRRVAHLCGMVIGGFTFGEQKSAVAARNDGLSGLRHALPALLTIDGGDAAAAPLFLAQSVRFAALARAVARQNGAGFPVEADAAIQQAAHFLDRLNAGIGALPPFGDAPFGGVCGVGWPLGPVLSNAMRVATPTVDAVGKTWRMWTFRQGGAVIAQQSIKGETARVVVWFAEGAMGHHAPMQLWFNVGNIVVLGEPGPEGDRFPPAHGVPIVDGTGPSVATMNVSRVDGKKARIEGTARIGVVPWERSVLLNQARVLVSDRFDGAGTHTVEQRWPLGSGWQVESAKDGWTARQGNLTLVIQLPSALRWTLAAGDSPAFVGVGRVASGTTVVASFEVR